MQINIRTWMFIVCWCISLTSAGKTADVYMPVTVLGPVAGDFSRHASRLNHYNQPDFKLTAAQCAQTFTSLIEATPLEDKVKLNHIKDAAAGWLSGKYGFNTKVADQPTMNAYIALATQIRCVTEILPPPLERGIIASPTRFERVYPAHYQTTKSAGYYHFLQRMDASAQRYFRYHEDYLKEMHSNFLAPRSHYLKIGEDDSDEIIIRYVLNFRRRLGLHSQRQMALGKPDDYPNWGHQSSRECELHGRAASHEGLARAM